MCKIKFYKDILCGILLTFLLIFLYAETCCAKNVIIEDDCKFNLEDIDGMKDQMLEIKTLIGKVKSKVVNNETGLAYIGTFLYIVDMPLEEIKRALSPAEHYNANSQHMDAYDKKVLYEFIVTTAKTVSKELRSFIPVADSHLKTGSVGPLESSYNKMKIILATLADAIDDDVVLNECCYNE